MKPHFLLLAMLGFASGMLLVKLVVWAINRFRKTAHLPTGNPVLGTPFVEPFVEPSVDLRITDFDIGDIVTPISPRNHSYGEDFVVSNIWPTGEGGVDGRVITGRQSFLPSQLLIVKKNRK